MPSTVVAFGEVLWDLFPTGAVLGGAPFNFVYRVGALGERGVMASRLGSDDLGDRAFNRIAALGMDTRYIQRDADRPTGTVAVSLDARGAPEYSIVRDVAYDAIAAEPDLLALVREADCLCFGTLIQRSPTSRQTLRGLLDAFRGRWRLLDLNLRGDCWTRESVLSSIGKADMLKLNDGEAAEIAPFFGLPPEPLQRLAEGLLRMTRLEAVVITLGAAGSFAVSRAGESAYERGYAVRVVDTVGSGDAFTAGFIHVLLGGGTLRDACGLGNALGALVAGQEGGTQPLDPREIESFAAGGRRGTPDPRFS